MLANAQADVKSDLNTFIRTAQFSKLASMLKVVNDPNFDSDFTFTQDDFIEVFYNLAKLEKTHDNDYVIALHRLIDIAQRKGFNLADASNSYARHNAPKSLLRVACELERNAFARELVVQGANPFLADADGKSPLGRAFEMDENDVRLLLPRAKILTVQETFMSIMKQDEQQYSSENVNRLIEQMSPASLEKYFDNEAGYDFLVKLFSNSLGCKRVLSPANQDKLYRLAETSNKIEQFVHAVKRIRDNMINSEQDEDAVSQVLVAEIEEKDPQKRTRLAILFANPKIAARIKETFAVSVENYMAEILWRTDRKHSLQISVEYIARNTSDGPFNHPDRYALFRDDLMKKMGEGKYDKNSFTKKDFLNCCHESLRFARIFSDSYVVGMLKPFIIPFAIDAGIDVVQVLNKNNYRFGPLLLAAYQKGGGKVLLKYLMNDVGLSRFACDKDNQCALSLAFSRKDRVGINTLLCFGGDYGDDYKDIRQAFINLIRFHIATDSDQVLNRILLQIPVPVLREYLATDDGYDFMLAYFSNTIRQRNSGHSNLEIRGCGRVLDNATLEHLYEAAKEMYIDSFIPAIKKAIAYHRTITSANKDSDLIFKQKLAEEISEKDPTKQSLLAKLFAIPRFWKGCIAENSELKQVLGIADTKQKDRVPVTRHSGSRETPEHALTSPKAQMAQLK